MKKSHLTDRDMTLAGCTADGTRIWRGAAVRHGNKHAGGASVPGGLRRINARRCEAPAPDADTAKTPEGAVPVLPAGFHG